MKRNEANRSIVLPINNEIRQLLSASAGAECFHYFLFFLGYFSQLPQLGVLTQRKINFSAAITPIMPEESSAACTGGKSKRGARSGRLTQTKANQLTLHISHQEQLTSVDRHTRA